MRRALSLSSHDPAAIERADDLTARAHRLRRKGELRRALVALREACGLDEQDAARWLWLSDVLGMLGKRDEAEQAMRHALFLRQTSGEKRKANVIRALLLQLGRVH